MKRSKKQVVKEGIKKGINQEGYSIDFKRLNRERQCQRGISLSASNWALNWISRWFSKKEFPSTLKASGLTSLISLFLFIPELSFAADHAGAFSDAATAVSAMLKGTLGKTIALSSLTLGVVSSAIRFNGPVLLGSAAVATAVGVGPSIIDKLV